MTKVTHNLGFKVLALFLAVISAVLSLRSFSFSSMSLNSFEEVLSLMGLFLAEELRRSELRYRELSLTDDLTGLYNARHFFKQLQAEVDRSMRHQNPLSLCILDVDHFKRYNDSHGHLCGDAVLAELGRIILHRIRESDSAYRYGGEEFFIILPATCREEAARVAERVRQAFLEHAFFPKDGCEVHVSLSIGVTSFRRGESVSDLVERVDQNLYVAKNAGRNTTVCR